MTASKLSLCEAHAALDLSRERVGTALARVEVSVVRCAEIESLIERHTRIVALARDLLTRARQDADLCESELGRALDDRAAAIRDLRRARALAEHAAEIEDLQRAAAESLPRPEEVWDGAAGLACPIDDQPNPTKDRAA